MNVLGTWTSKGLPRPSWSNARGDVRTLSQLKIPFFFCFMNVPDMRRPLETTIPPSPSPGHLYISGSYHPKPGGLKNVVQWKRRAFALQF